MAVAEKSRHRESGNSESYMAYKQLTDDLKTLQADLSALRRDVGEMSGTAAADAKHRLEAGIASVQAQARDVIDSAASELRDFELQAENAVKKRPITAVAAALAIGFFIGSLARRP